MILPDVNVLVYAHRDDVAQHGGYATWLAQTAEGNEAFALTSSSTAGFVRIVTHPRIFEEPSATDVAISFVEALAASPVCRWLEPGERWWSIFAGLCTRAGGRGNLVPDAHLAAVAVEHGCRLATADHGFARFPDLQWFHPLADTRT